MNDGRKERSSEVLVARPDGGDGLLCLRTSWSKRQRELRKSVHSAWAALAISGDATHAARLIFEMQWCA